MEYVDLTAEERLFSNGRLLCLFSGNGVLHGSYRRPVWMSGRLYYRMRNKKFLNLHSLMKDNFNCEIEPVVEWFNALVKEIDVHNAKLRQEHKDQFLAKEASRKRKQTIIKRLLDGKITPACAEVYLGKETVERLLSDEPTSGTMTKRERDKPFVFVNEFSSDYAAEEQPAEFWGFKSENTRP